MTMHFSSENCDKKFHVFNGIFVRSENRNWVCMFMRMRKLEGRRRTSLSNEGFDKPTQRTEEDKLYSPTKIHISIKLTATREKGNNEKSIKVTRKVDWVCVIRLVASKTVINISSNDKSSSYLSLLC
jgi:hypothetical protein